MRNLDELVDRFKRVAHIGQRQLTIIEQEKLDAAEREAEAELSRLASWASDQICTEDFLPFIERKIAVLESERVKILSDHPRLCDTLGRESELKALVAQFREWAAKA